MERVIVDGYNVIHAWPQLKRLLDDASLEAARDKLIERLSVFGMVAGADVTVVFDAHHSTARTSSEELVEGVHVLFTRKGHSADHAIERIAYEASQAGDAITVATSDRFQRDLVRGMGGAVISALELERRVVDAEQELGSVTREPPRPARPHLEARDADTCVRGPGPSSSRMQRCAPPSATPSFVSAS